MIYFICVIRIYTNIYEYIIIYNHISSIMCFVVVNTKTHLNYWIRGKILHFSIIYQLYKGIKLHFGAHKNINRCSMQSEFVIK